jgi:ATP-dependent Lon protease
MADQDPSNLGLFPLGLVLLPGERVPLHIFEPKYRALIADCTLQAQPFVISLETEGGVAKIGCTAYPETLLRRFDDGRMNLIVEGRTRVEIVEQTGGQAYLTARMAPIADLDEPVDPALATEARERFHTLSEAIAGAVHDPVTSEDVPLSYAIAGSIELEPVTKQQLLESRSESERLLLVHGLLDLALAGLDRSKVAAERAHTNGKVNLQ